MIRHNVIDMILATEMTKHFEYLAKFVNVCSSRSNDSQSECFEVLCHYFGIIIKKFNFGRPECTLALLSFIIVREHSSDAKIPCESFGKESNNATTASYNTIYKHFIFS